MMDKRGVEFLHFLSALFIVERDFCCFCNLIRESMDPVNLMVVVMMSFAFVHDYVSKAPRLAIHESNDDYYLRRECFPGVILKIANNTMREILKPDNRCPIFCEQAHQDMVSDSRYILYKKKYEEMLKLLNQKYGRGLGKAELTEEIDITGALDLETTNRLLKITFKLNEIAYFYQESQSSDVLKHPNYIQQFNEFHKKECRKKDALRRTGQQAKRIFQPAPRFFASKKQSKASFLKKH